jgi:hypothetical protein
MALFITKKQFNIIIVEYLVKIDNKAFLQRINKTWIFNDASGCRTNWKLIRNIINKQQHVNDAKHLANTVFDLIIYPFIVS